MSSPRCRKNIGWGWRKNFLCASGPCRSIITQSRKAFAKAATSSRVIAMMLLRLRRPIMLANHVGWHAHFVRDENARLRMKEEFRLIGRRPAVHADVVKG